MNRTDRMLAIVLELQAHGTRRAEDLAATFETSKRTIYRDIQALCEAGVPVVAEAGHGYWLDDSYFLPPLRFTTDEAMLLLLGGELVARSFDAELRTAAASASSKIAGSLPAERRDAVRVAQALIRFVNEDVQQNPAEAARLPLLRRAVFQQRTVRFTYHARQRADDAPASREVDPYGLVCVLGAWYISGYDHDRAALRTFRVERMDDLHVMANTFERPADYQLAPRDEGRDTVVQVLFTPQAARWVREARMYFTVTEEDRADGLLVTLHVRHTDDVLQWLLGWGAQVRVLHPPELRTRIAAEAQALLEAHQA